MLRSDKNKLLDMLLKVRQTFSRDLMISGISKLCLCYLALTLFTGWTFSAYAPYIKINCSLGNNIVIYLNSSSADNKLYYDESNQLLVNMSGSNQYGYLERNGIQYQVTFPTYDQPYYRLTNNYDIVYITQVTEIVEKHNVNLYSQYDKQFMVTCALLVLTFFSFLRRGN